MPWLQDAQRIIDAKVSEIEKSSSAANQSNRQPSQFNQNIATQVSYVEKQQQNNYSRKSSPASNHTPATFDLGSGLAALFIGLPYEIALIVIIDLIICIYNISEGTHDASNADLFLVFLVIPITVHVITFVLGAFSVIDY